MLVSLENAERALVAELTKALLAEIREDVRESLATNPVVWSKATTAKMIGGELDPASIKYVDKLIAQGEIDVFHSSEEGGRGTRVWVVPESVEAWKRREWKKRRRNGRRPLTE